MKKLIIILLLLSICVCKADFTGGYGSPQGVLTNATKFNPRVSLLPRQIVSGTWFNNEYIESLTNNAIRNVFYCPNDCFDPIVSFTGWSLNTPYGNIVPNGAIWFVNMTLEYPSNCFYTITQNGNTNVMVSSLGTTFADPVAMYLPGGAILGCRQWWFNTNGTALPFTHGYVANVTGLNQTNIGKEWSMRNLTNNVAYSMIYGGDGANNGNAYAVSPATITGFSTNTVSVFVIGDSIAHSPNPNQGMGYHVSYVTEGLWGRYPYVMGACGGEWIESYSDTNNWQAYLLGLQVCDIVYIHLGVNNIYNLDSFSNMTNKFSKLVLNLKAHGKRVIASDITPISTSTDTWLTEANQTAIDQNGRTNFNNWLYSQPYGISVVRAGTSVESTNKPGCWRVDGVLSTANSGGGGLHPSTYGITNYMSKALISASNYFKY